jgi:hypothetical protein
VPDVRDASDNRAGGCEQAGRRPERVPRIGEVLDHVVEDDAVELPVGCVIRERSSDDNIEAVTGDLGRCGVRLDPPHLYPWPFRFQHDPEATECTADVEHRACLSRDEGFDVVSGVVAVGKVGRLHAPQYFIGAVGIREARRSARNVTPSTNRYRWPPAFVDSRRQ